jgi:uncharacterized protein DUF4338
MTHAQLIDQHREDAPGRPRPVLETAETVATAETATPSELVPPSKPVADEEQTASWIWFDEHVKCGRKARRLLRWFARLLDPIGPDGQRVAAVAALKTELETRARKNRVTVADRQRVRVCASVLFDLAEHGWQIRLTRRGIDIASPQTAVSPLDEKERVRAAHLIERNSQLSQPATMQFVRNMERRRLTKRGWKSIFSLMRDGRSFADQLAGVRQVADVNEPAASAAARACIDPYVQVIGPRQVDSFTGLRLMDVWRYFRHTWATTYQSTPGRKIFVLIRDRAAPDHPVIGIGALGSAIVQMSQRDRWIGWNAEAFLAELDARPTAKWARWVSESLGSLTSCIYRRDLVRAGYLSNRDLKSPTPEAIGRLREAAKRARKAHRLFAHVGKHKAKTRAVDSRNQARAQGAPNWKRQALTYLFQAKRAETLADLLEVRQRLLASGFEKPTTQALATLMSKSAGRRAVQTILRHVRAVHVGVDMLDVTVCGAVAPYGPVLGGKLVALLMASPDVVAAYEKRYRRAESVIASSMAGRAVRRRPRLVLLGTTSLYGVASSQYNRIVVPANVLNTEGELRYERLGHTAGFGSYHFSRETMAQLEIVAAQGRRGREVNSIFGEGVNPKLRKVRAALDAIGLPSDDLLQHGSPRLIYGIPLATNFREVLIGTAKRPRYLLSPRKPKEGTQILVDYWTRRWFVPRIARGDVLDNVRIHTLVYPVSHGARVPLPDRKGDIAEGHHHHPEAPPSP